MTYLFYAIIFLGLIICQTTILSRIPLAGEIYDLVIAFIIYLGIFRPFRESLLVVLLAGFIMDNLSGSPFGIYISAYFWIFAGLQRSGQWFRIGDSILLPFVVAAGVLFENIIFFGTIYILGSSEMNSSFVIRTTAIQIAWALVTGLLLLRMISFAHQLWDNLHGKVVTARNGQTKD